MQHHRLTMKGITGERQECLLSTLSMIDSNSCLVFSFNFRSFEHVGRWVDEARSRSSPATIMLLGNKSDDKRQVLVFVATNVSRFNMKKDLHCQSSTTHFSLKFLPKL